MVSSGWDKKEAKLASLKILSLPSACSELALNLLSCPPRTHAKTIGARGEGDTDSQLPSRTVYVAENEINMSESVAKSSGRVRITCELFASNSGDGDSRSPHSALKAQHLHCASALL